jgi:hypothetical protein
MSGTCTADEQYFKAVVTCAIELWEKLSSTPNSLSKTPAVAQPGS